jgi:Ca-activated chloride channel family protein
MPTSSAAVPVLKSFWLVLILALLQVSPLAQTSLNDVYVTPRQASGATTLGSGVPAGGSYLHVIRNDVNLVLRPVSVTDPMQRLVTGLASENFQVFEGKKAQEIRHFSSEDAPVSVGIILDSSGSMGDKVDRVREAVNQFCLAANPQDEFFLITFSEQPHLARDFTHKPEDLQNALLYTRPRGRTALLDAIYMGIGTMRRAKYAKKALLIISDGGDNHSRYDEREVRSAVKESDAMVYSIGVFDRRAPTLEELRGPELLSSIAEPSGGRAFTIFNVSELPSVAHRIGTELRTQYVLGYRPEQAPHDGKWHKINVKLRLPRKLSFLQPHAKKGYYAQHSEAIVLQERSDRASDE